LTFTETPSGILIGLFPILDITYFLKYITD
jgi:hypothetical protein